MTAMVTAQDETVQLRRLIEFAADVAELANERPDPRPAQPDQLHADLLTLKGDEDD